MGFTDFMKKLVKKPQVINSEPIEKKLPEELELNSYLEQERRDKLRTVVQQKRKQHNNMFMYKPAYNHNKGIKSSFSHSKNNLNFRNPKAKTNPNLFFKS